MVDAIVIGAGLFGQLIARGLEETGRRVILVDSQEPHAGSPPAACLIRKEWSGKLPVGVFDAGVGWLGERFTTYEKELHQVGNARNPIIKPLWFNPKELMRYQPVICKVNQPVPVGKLDWCVSGSSFMEDAPLVVVAAGVWSQELVPWYPLTMVGKGGAAWLYRDVMKLGFITSWAPYKQIVGFHRGDGYWVSDSSAILHENFTLERKLQSYDRCRSAAGIDKGQHPYKELYGIRPYTVEQPCVCKQIKPGLWVAVGARKNGTLLGAWCAQKIVRETS